MADLLLNPIIDDTKLSEQTRKLEQQLSTFDQKQIASSKTKIQLQERYNQLLQQQLSIQNRINTAATVGQRLSARGAALGNAFQRGMVGGRGGMLAQGVGGALAQGGLGAAGTAAAAGLGAGLGVGGSRYSNIGDYQRRGTWKNRETTVGGTHLYTNIPSDIAAAYQHKTINSWLQNNPGFSGGALPSNIYKESFNRYIALNDRANRSFLGRNIGVNNMRSLDRSFNPLRSSAWKIAEYGAVARAGRFLSKGGGIGGGLRSLGKAGGTATLLAAGAYGLGGVVGMLGGKSAQQVGESQNFNVLDSAAEDTVNTLAKSSWFQGNKNVMVSQGFGGGAVKISSVKGLVDTSKDEKSFEQSEDTLRREKITLRNKLTMRGNALESNLENIKTDRERMEKGLSYNIDYNQSHRAGLLTAAAASATGTTGESGLDKLTSIEKSSLAELKSIKEQLENL